MTARPAIAPRDQEPDRGRGARFGGTSPATIKNLIVVAGSDLSARATIKNLIAVAGGRGLSQRATIKNLIVAATCDFSNLATIKNLIVPQARRRVRARRATRGGDALRRPRDGR